MNINHELNNHNEIMVFFHFFFSAGGLILDLMVNRYEGIAVFQPVINGVGGNLVSILSSRMSTRLHQYYELGYLPEDERVVISPYKLFFSGSKFSFFYF